MIKDLRSWSVLIGRLFMAFIFIFSAIHRMTNFQEAVMYSHSVGVHTALNFRLVLATILELIGAVSFILGYKIEIGAICLLIFMIPVTILFHGFWAYTGQEQAMQLMHFVMNTSLIGGILFVLGMGAGPFSLDNLCKKRLAK